VWLPLDTPFAFLKALVFAPIILFYLATDKSMRENLKARYKAYKRFITIGRIKDSRLITKYGYGEYANCDCLGCRLARASIRRYIKKYYLKAYCLRCKKEVDIKNPEKVILNNKREAIKGICSVCGSTVFRIGKFYGDTFFKS